MGKQFIQLKYIQNIGKQYNLKYYYMSITYNNRICIYDIYNKNIKSVNITLKCEKVHLYSETFLALAAFKAAVIQALFKGR